MGKGQMYDSEDNRTGRVDAVYHSAEFAEVIVDMLGNIRELNARVDQLRAEVDKLRHALAEDYPPDKPTPPAPPPAEYPPSRGGRK